MLNEKYFKFSLWPQSHTFGFWKTSSFAFLCFLRIAVSSCDYKNILPAFHQRIPKENLEKK